ncbi:hypothetical protein ID866_8367 [Astraeus odoratus]|nr:hypothetical protein ID866_8367 [Astraeus odoratus]
MVSFTVSLSTIHLSAAWAMCRCAVHD